MPVDNVPPGLNIHKQNNMLQDLSRLCESYQLPYTPDPNIEERLFKKGTRLTSWTHTVHHTAMGMVLLAGSLKAQRLLVATSVDEPSSLMALSHALFLQSWGQVRLEVTRIVSM